MPEEKKYELYRDEYYRYQSLHTQNLIEQDKALLQLSVGLLAAIAAFGKNVVLLNKVLGIITVVFLVVTVVQVMIGYYLSNKYFEYIKVKLTENYQKNKKLSQDINDNLTGKINDQLNVSVFITFTLGIIFFLVLVIMYIIGLKP